MNSGRDNYFRTIYYERSLIIWKNALDFRLFLFPAVFQISDGDKIHILSFVCFTKDLVMKVYVLM